MIILVVKPGPAVVVVASSQNMKSEFHVHRPTHRVESEICQHGAAEVACDCAVVTACCCVDAPCDACVTVDDPVATCVDAAA